jgi:hypothetical protein
MEVVEAVAVAPAAVEVVVSVATGRGGLPPSTSLPAAHHALPSADQLTPIALPPLLSPLSPLRAPMRPCAACWPSPWWWMACAAACTRA